MPNLTQKALDVSLGTTAEVASKVDYAPTFRTLVKSRPKSNFDAIPDAHKEAATSGSKEGDVSMKAASKINSTAPVATVNDNQKVRRPILFVQVVQQEIPILICF